MRPVFLDLGDVLEIHQDQIRRYGGASGVRDIGLLQSAIAMAQAGWRGEYFHSFPFEMAAAYLYHIARHHPFLDGNQRVGATVMLVFLELNDVHVSLPNARLVDLVMRVAKGKLGKPGIAAFLQQFAKGP